jgi:hypothetical protein
MQLQRVIHRPRWGEYYCTSKAPTTYSSSVPWGTTGTVKFAAATTTTTQGLKIRQIGKIQTSPDPIFRWNFGWAVPEVAWTVLIFRKSATTQSAGPICKTCYYLCMISPGVILIFVNSRPESIFWPWFSVRMQITSHAKFYLSLSNPEQAARWANAIIETPGGSLSEHGQ